MLYGFGNRERGRRWKWRRRHTHTYTHQSQFPPLEILTNIKNSNINVVYILNKWEWAWFDFRWRFIAIFVVGIFHSFSKQNPCVFHSECNLECGFYYQATINRPVAIYFPWNCSVSSHFLHNLSRSEFISFCCCCWSTITR